MADHDSELRGSAQQALEQCRALMLMIESGDMEATPARIWHLRGAIDALEALLDESRPQSPAGTGPVPGPA